MPQRGFGSTGWRSDESTEGVGSGAVTRVVFRSPEEGRRMSLERVPRTRSHFRLRKVPDRVTGAVEAGGEERRSREVGRETRSVGLRNKDLVWSV